MRMLAILSIVAAVVTGILAWMPAKQADATVETLEGKYLTAGYAEVSADDITSLEVMTRDDAAGAVSLFHVAHKNGQWVIPSRYDYPADSGTRVGDTAGGVLNIKRGALVGSETSQHAKFGLVDPETGESTDAEDFGQRVRLKDAGGKALVDLIIGHEAEHTDAMRFVREAGDDAVYLAAVDVNISTKFKDWVETDLLKIDRADIRSIHVLDYYVDEEKGRVVSRANTGVAKPKDAMAWTSEQTPEGHTVSGGTIDEIIAEATQLKLADIKPLNQGLLRRCGFFVQEGEGGRTDVFGNEGELNLQLKDGTIYKLYFGEIAVDDAAAKKDTGKDPAEKKGGAHNRYLVVVVEYNPDLDEDAKAKAPEEEGDEAHKKDDSPAGLAKAKKEMGRFLKFFYIIDDDSFKKLRPPMEKLFEAMELKKADLHGEKIPDEMELEKGNAGLEYADLVVGTGPPVVTGDRVRVHYTGYLYKGGTKFDSSRDGGQPFSFTIDAGDVIKGWDQGVTGMQVGGKRKLVIPPELGYGKAGSPPKIPADAKLVFDVELLSIEGKPATPKAEAPAEPKADAKPAETKAEPKAEAKPAEEKPVPAEAESETKAKPAEAKPATAEPEAAPGVE